MCQCLILNVRYQPSITSVGITLVSTKKNGGVFSIPREMHRFHPKPSLKHFPLNSHPPNLF